MSGSEGTAHGDTIRDGVTPPAQSLVTAARRHLGMDVAFVAEFAAGRRIFRFVDAVPGAVRLEVGEGDELTATYCQQIVDGTTPEVIPDTAAEPTVRDLAVTAQLGIASYIGVPVRFSDGRVFGTLCCLSHTKQPMLDDADRRYLAVLAETIASELESTRRTHEGRDESRRRIERAVADRQFFPVFQPIVDLSTGAVVGAEALTRFTDDDRGPLAWFAEAATVGLGVDLEITAAVVAATAFRGSADAYLAVNLSPSALVRLEEILDTAGLDPRAVVVELTEHNEVADYTALQQTCRAVRELAVRLAVDDTGAGVSSLRHILELSPEIIKLDLSLTLGIDADPVRQALADALASFARRVGAVVIAEGIETDAQLRTVADLGIEYGQGYYLGAPAALPLPPDVAVVRSRSR